MQQQINARSTINVTTTIHATIIHETTFMQQQFMQQQLVVVYIVCTVCDTTYTYILI